MKFRLPIYHLSLDEYVSGFGNYWKIINFMAKNEGNAVEAE